MRVQDEAFLVQHDLNDDGWRSRTAAWTKPQALQLYHDLLQRYREWNEAAGGAAASPADEDVEVAVFRYSSDEDSSGSDSEVIEFVTPRDREDAARNAPVQGGEDSLTVDERPDTVSSDHPRESWIQPVLAGQCPSGDDKLPVQDEASKSPSADTGQALRRHRVQLSAPHSQAAHLRPAHVRHAEAAQSNLAALHWRLLREEQADALGANLDGGALNTLRHFCLQLENLIRLRQWMSEKPSDRLMNTDC